MEKKRITLIKVGHVNHLLDIEKISKWKSKLFTIEEVQSLEYLQNSDILDGYLDQKFTKENLEKLIICPKNSDLAVAITSYRFADNFYLHKIGDKCCGISIYGINEILDTKNIPIEYFIIKQLYFIYGLLIFGSEDIYKVPHRDTRGCLFDFNGDRKDLLYNTEKPIICDYCKNKLKNKQISQKEIQILDKELKKIKIPLIFKIERYIKKHPLISMIISALIGIGINVICELIYKIVKFNIEN